MDAFIEADQASQDRQCDEDRIRVLVYYTKNRFTENYVCLSYMLHYIGCIQLSKSIKLLVLLVVPMTAMRMPQVVHSKSV